MKNYLILAIAVLLIFSCNDKKTSKEKPMNNTNSKENPMDTTKYKNTEIYLTVIKDCEPITIDCIQFSDNRGGAVSIPGSQEFFTSIVNPGKKVTWMGKDTIYTIDIIDVSFKPNNGSTAILKSKPSKINGTIVGKVKDKGGDTNFSNEFYTITISIKKDTITIDPVIQLHN